jgi:plasmid stability protein
MKTVDLTLRKCPGDIHAALVRRAERKNVSLRSEAIETLRSALGSDLSLDEEALRRRIEQIPSRVGLPLSEARQAIREGRK